MDVEEDPTIREVSALAIVFAFVLNHFMSIVLILAAVFLCSVLATIFELMFSPLKAFAFSAVVTSGGCAVLFLINAQRLIERERSENKEPE